VPPSPDFSIPQLGLFSAKFSPHHLARFAIVYVRQSDPQQVVKHQESTRLQYGLRDQVVALGWPPERVLIIDDDLGVTANRGLALPEAEGRAGFQRLMTEVGLDHVGAIFGREFSRLVRSCLEIQRLMDVCAVFGTLIVDEDGVYDPSNYNDRLLLGLKGAISEAELHILKQRMLEAKLAKARRGELGMQVPLGYLRTPAGEVIKDPDEQVQSIVQLIFEQFTARGSTNGVLRYLVEHHLELPIRVRSGPQKGDLEWHRPNRMTLLNLLHNPAYAGAFVYGKRPLDPRRKQPGRRNTGKTVAAPGQWQVLLKERWPAYLTWEQFEQNLQQLEHNRTTVLGVPRHGAALLSGLLHCGRCGHRLVPSYHAPGYRYSCIRDACDYGAPLCESLAGPALDAHISALVLRALEPAALEISLRVAEDLEAEHRRLEEQWRQRLERAHYEVTRAQRQYDAVEPENRLVARTLEKLLEEKLRAQQTLVEEHQRWQRQQPSPLSAAERESIRALASDLPALWAAPTTTPQDRQAIIRQLIDQVVATVVGETEQVEVVIHWAGGHQTKTSVLRPVARLDQLSYWPQLRARILALRRQGLPSREVAARLNAEGWHPPKRRDTFTSEMVRSVLSRQGLARWKQRSGPHPELRPNEWLLLDLAAKLQMPTVTLYNWIRRGWVTARQLQQRTRARPLWAINADEQEIARLLTLRTAPKHEWRGRLRESRAPPGDVVT
jgi:DNA invertase Pin-like site-specific DNA recombinase